MYFNAEQPDTADQIGQVLRRLYTTDLRALMATCVDILDQRDGDVDLEDDDPAGDTLEEHGEHPTDDGTTMLAVKPAYSIDQSRGPINEQAAYLAHRVKDLGLVQTDRGTWAFAR